MSGFNFQFWFQFLYDEYVQFLRDNLMVDNVFFDFRFRSWSVGKGFLGQLDGWGYFLEYIIFFYKESFEKCLNFKLNLVYYEKLFFFKYCIFKI